MLSYQHAYHAGNFADVHKHWMLVLLLEALSRKDKPWRYLDTHAGRGHYQLDTEMALKTGEWQQGIARLMALQNQAPEVWQSYLRLVDKAQPTREALVNYPGSPQIAAWLQRNQDRSVLCELHPQEFANLKSHFRRSKTSYLHFRDGFEGAFALIPPPEKRGLILIDPSYELEQDYLRIPAYLEQVAQRWASACVAVWYPVLAGFRQEALLEALLHGPLNKILRSEVRLQGKTSGLLGSGMLVFNPPWRLDEQLQQGWAFLSEGLGLDARHSVAADWLKPELTSPGKQ